MTATDLHDTPADRVYRGLRLLRADIAAAAEAVDNTIAELSPDERPIDTRLYLLAHLHEITEALLGPDETREAP